MSDNTKIEWTDATWNPIKGCSRVSPGCLNCYAERQAHRFNKSGYWAEGLTVIRQGRPGWSGAISHCPDTLAKPTRWRKPRRVFVCSGSDMAHESADPAFQLAMFGIMAATPHHTYQVLTKRPKALRDLFDSLERRSEKARELFPADSKAWRTHQVLAAASLAQGVARLEPGSHWPLPNVWIGVSAEDQQRYDERWPELAGIPAALRWISAEPLLGPINLRLDREERPDWVVVGGESGPGARPCAMEWIQHIVDQCREHRVPVFVKQLGACIVSEGRAADSVEEANEIRRLSGFSERNDRWLWFAGLADRKGGDPREWPDHFQVRLYPGEKLVFPGPEEGDTGDSDIPF